MKRGGRFSYLPFGISVASTERLHRNVLGELGQVLLPPVPQVRER